MICLSFATRLNLETLAKGQKEGVGLEIIQTILKRIVQMPFRDNSWLTTLMEKYFERYKKLLPKCVDRTMGLSDFKIWTWNLTPPPPKKELPLDHHVPVKKGKNINVTVYSRYIYHLQSFFIYSTVMIDTRERKVQDQMPDGKNSFLFISTAL